MSQHPKHLRTKIYGIYPACTCRYKSSVDNGGRLFATPCSHLYEAISDGSTQSPVEWEIKTCVHCWYGERKNEYGIPWTFSCLCTSPYARAICPSRSQVWGFLYRCVCVCVRAHLFSLWDSPSFIYASSLLQAIFMINLSFQLRYIKHDSSLKPSARSCVWAWGSHLAPSLPTFA